MNTYVFDILSSNELGSICFSNTKMDVWFFDIGRYVVLNISHSLFRNKRFNSKIYQNYFTRSIHKYNPPIFEEWVIQYSFMNIFYISNVKKWGFFFHLVSQDICRVFQIDEDWSKKKIKQPKWIQIMMEDEMQIFSIENTCFYVLRYN